MRKPRYQLLRHGLTACGAEVIECRADVWRGADDKTQHRHLAHKLLMLIGSYPALIWKYLRLPRHDCVVVSHPGLVDILILTIFARARRIPLIWDQFLPVYDTLVRDRRLIRPGGLPARALWCLEWLALRLADKVFLDTRTYARRIERDFGLPRGRIGAVPVGAEAQFFTSSHPKPSEGALKVLFYGQFIPLHGVDHIIAAARRLSNESIDWLLIGSGQESSRIRSELSEAPLPRLSWIDRVDYADLIRYLRDADVCLGIFGTSEKAASVVPNKVYQALAAGCPLITRDSPAIRELIEHSPPHMTLVPPGDPEALATAVVDVATAKASGALAACMPPTAPIDAPAVGAAFLDFVSVNGTSSDDC